MNLSTSTVPVAMLLMQLICHAKSTFVYYVFHTVCCAMLSYRAVTALTIWCANSYLQLPLIFVKFECAILWEIVHWVAASTEMHHEVAAAINPLEVVMKDTDKGLMISLKSGRIYIVSNACEEQEYLWIGMRHEKDGTWVVEAMKRAFLNSSSVSVSTCWLDKGYMNTVPRVHFLKRSAETAEMAAVEQHLPRVEDAVVQMQ